jgi:hypothetical protein
MLELLRIPGKTTEQRLVAYPESRGGSHGPGKARASGSGRMASGSVEELLEISDEEAALLEASL